MQLCRQLSATETRFCNGNAEKHLNNRASVTHTHVAVRGLTTAEPTEAENSAPSESKDILPTEKSSK